MFDRIHAREMLRIIRPIGMLGILVGLAISMPELLADDKPAKENADAVQTPFAGTITGEDGEKVTDAKISIYGPAYYRASTDENGRFEFLDADKPGQYQVSIRSDKWASISEYNQMPKVILVPGKAVTQNFVLPRAWQAQVTVTDEASDPIPRVTVYGQAIGSDRSQRMFTATTNADGIATIHGIKPMDSGFIVAASSKNFSAEHVIVKAAKAKELVKLKIVLRKGQSIKGKVICSDGNPASHWSLSALPTWWISSSWPGGVPIDEDGSYELKHITDQTYNVSVSIPHGDNMTTSRSVLSDGELLKLKQPLRLTLDHMSPASMSHLTGKIRWIGKPSNRNISISGYSAQTSEHIRGSIKAPKTEFKIGPFPKGIYRIRVENSELEVMNLRKIKNLDDLSAVEIPNEKPLVIVLRVRGKPHVQGVVLDAETKKPITNYRFRIVKHRTLEGPNYAQEDDLQVAANKQGEFQSDVVGPGVYSIMVFADGYALATSDQVNTTEDPDRQLTLLLKRGQKLEGLVVDEAGEPIDGAKVRALSMSSGTMPRVKDRYMTDTGHQKTVNGKFTFDNLPPYESFRIDHPDFAFHETKRVQISDDSPVLKIQLHKGATIRGRVFDRNGKPEPGVTLNFQDDDSYGGDDRKAGHFGAATTDENGDYEIHHMPSTVVYVSRTNEWEYVGLIRHAVVTENGQVHRLDFGGTSKLTGRMTANGQPMANARMQLGGPDSIFGAMKMRIRCNEEGEFCFFGPPVGDWHLYREIEGTRSEWTPLQIVSIRPGRDLDLGDQSVRTGRLTIVPKIQDGEIPKSAVVKFDHYDKVYMIGRDAGKPIARLNQNDPFEFDHVGAGDYLLRCFGIGQFSISQRLKLSEDQIGQPIELMIPAATSTLNATVLDFQGKPFQQSLLICSDDGRIESRMSPNLMGVQPIYPPMKLPPGRYNVYGPLSLRPNTPSLAQFELKQGDDKPIEVRLQKPKANRHGRALIRVIDDQGVVIPCPVKMIGQDDKGFSLRMNLPDMLLIGPVGEFTAKINLEGFEPAEHPVKITAGILSFDEKLGNKITIQLRRSKAQVKTQRPTVPSETPRKRNE